MALVADRYCLIPSPVLLLRSAPAAVRALVLAPGLALDLDLASHSVQDRLSDLD